MEAWHPFWLAWGGTADPAGKGGDGRFQAGRGRQAFQLEAFLPSLELFGLGKIGIAWK